MEEDEIYRVQNNRRNINFDTGETYGSGFFDALTKIGKTITGKTASKLASKAAEKLIEKGAEKVGEKTGEVLGEKIHEKFSSTRRSKEPPTTAGVTTKPTEPTGELGMYGITEILDEVTKKREKKERKTLNDAIAAEFL